MQSVEVDVIHHLKDLRIFADIYNQIRIGYKDTVAATVATEAGLPHLSRQVFLDNIPEREAIAERFAVLVKCARREGLATISEVLAQPQLHSL